MSAVDDGPTPHDFGAPEVDEYAEKALRREDGMSKEKDEQTDAEADKQLRDDQRVGDKRRAEADRQAGQRNTGTLDKKGWA